MSKYIKKYTRKGNCPDCGVGTGSAHHLNCSELQALQKQGRGYKAGKLSKVKRIINIIKE